MDPRYWERIGDDYEQDIFDSARMDRRGVIRARILEHADPRALACDFGCGVGHYLPLLSPLFRRVYGFDGANSLLRQAEKRCAGLGNVRLARANLAGIRPDLAIPKVRFAVCANVLISEDETARQRILSTVHRNVARGGCVLLVVPSLESALYSNGRLVEWNERLGHSAAEALASGIPPTARSAGELLRGLVRIEGVRTKHFVREEALVTLAERGFSVESVDKVEYAWETEFEDPPKWITSSPGPWDWLLVARKL